MDAADFSANVSRFTGFAGLYDRFRPSPPGVLADLLTRLARTGDDPRVVDLGCGTGLSTRYWSERAREVIGVEPTVAMIAEATAKGGRNVRYVQGFSHATGLPDQCTDIVTCSQSLHWMEPSATFTESARILRPGGVFAAYDYDWPPVTGFWELDAIYTACMERSRKLEKECGLDADLKFQAKEGHFGRMRESGAFRQVRESAVHHQDEGNAARLIGLLFSQGHVQTHLKRGATEHELGIDRLREAATSLLGEGWWPWLWTSRVRIGIV